MRSSYRFPTRPDAASKSAQRSRKRNRVLAFISLVLVVGVGIRVLGGAWQKPQAVLVLGGAEEREVFAAKFAQEHPNLPIWVSSGGPQEYVEWVFTQAGISPDRLHLDYRALDTVTNFTTMVDEFKQHKIDSVYLITSDYHMRRAVVIGEIILGSQGISFQPIAVPSDSSPEPVEKVLRDAVRSILWVTTGRTGANLAYFWHRY
jgi:uncharacterized SAM-binding protein YcdF (DUF218 family)